MSLLSKRSNPLISETAISLLNKRIEQEELSSRLYLSMSVWLDDNGYKGASKKWREYSNEELTHADWSRNYLLAMGVQPNTPALQAPKQTYSGLPEIINMSYAHEILVSKQCKEMATAAQKEGDHMLYQLALKYLAEQVEEHEKMQDLLDKLEAFGTDKIALRLLDEELGK